MGRVPGEAEATLVRGVRLNSPIFVNNVDIRHNVVQTVVSGSDMHLVLGSAVSLATGQEYARAAYTALHRSGVIKPAGAASSKSLKDKQSYIDNSDDESPNARRGSKRSLAGMFKKIAVSRNIRTLLCMFLFQPTVLKASQAKQMLKLISSEKDFVLGPIH